MLQGTFGTQKNTSLMSEYASLVGDAVLRHRARQAERTARIEAELAHKVKSEFIANMSHELRTPLNTVIGFSKILCEHNRRRLADGDVVQYAQLINDAANHLLAVINDILDISKMQSGRYTIDAREVAIDEIAQASAATFKLTAEEAGVTLRHRIGYDLPLVRGDAAKLHQIISNLISNAIKFTPRGGTVSLEAVRGEHDGVTIRVQDTGIGMTPEELRIALTPFGQVDGGRTRWREGTGLGLPIAKALVELHGGEMIIESAKDSGTTITCRLPSRHQVSVSRVRETLEGRLT
jgi:two-component system cell cycle sensor histidine kinase PleC